MKSAQVRSRLVEALRVDLVGPGADSELASEVLDQAPSRWYLTGFLVPLEAGVEQKCDESGQDELDLQGDDDDDAPEPPAARRAFFASSIGISLLVSKKTRELELEASWGDYLSSAEGSDTDRDAPDPPGRLRWTRRDRRVTTTLKLPDATRKPKEVEVPESDGLRLAVAVRPVPPGAIKMGLAPEGARSVSIFLVNRRVPADDAEKRDERFIFQAGLAVRSNEPLIARPNQKGHGSTDWDEGVADLQYRDDYEYAVGHGVATRAEVDANGECRRVRAEWIPEAPVEQVAAAEIASVELGMEALGAVADAPAAARALQPFVAQYRAWIADQRGVLPSLSQERRETALELFQRAETAANRIESGIAALADPQALEAFRLANKTMARAARRRLDPKRESAAPAPRWRPFQLAFFLMNLPGIVDPLHPDREMVDLLFFPTGGGKTEAYLGLAAFTLVWRRLKNPGIASAGLSVLMRYTLRLLTLDQLGRAAALICALELERLKNPDKLGTWPFEIGLWVGRGATPNRMGAKGEHDPNTARCKTMDHNKDSSHNPAPIPLENCPWCGEKFKPNSFQLEPNFDQPTDLRVYCANRDCDFTRGRALPILTVDEPIYRRLPCFMIATVDKFAAMPWTGAVGGFFGRVDRHDGAGFYGPTAANTGERLPGPLLPPDLIIQDELHLISGPMGTMVGLYETALDALSSRPAGTATIRPKIVASTATVRRAESQIQALFNRSEVDVFPPPGPDRRDSFFATTRPATEVEPRLYLGIAAQGRSLKVVMLRTYLALLGAAQRAYEADGGQRNPANAADPYMTLLGYFNSLRELGGSRRIVEDEVVNRVAGYAARKRIGQGAGLFANRNLDLEVLELTSRVPTSKVSDAKRRLALAFPNKGRVDAALATNMISVGLDVTRLGLMVVLGQPKTCAEYIQATSRVGRDPERPGLIVTLLNVHRHRDRSHYERFEAFHRSFYRTVEATSVTPFSPRALDRGLAGALVALARLGHSPMTPAKGASDVERQRASLEFVVKTLSERAANHAQLEPAEAEEFRRTVRDRANDLLDAWCTIAHKCREDGGPLQYNQHEAGGAPPLLRGFLDPELANLNARHKKFRANRSMRDVEPSVNLWLKTLDGRDVAAED